MLPQIAVSLLGFAMVDVYPVTGPLSPLQSLKSTELPGYLQKRPYTLASKLLTHAT